MKRRERKLEAYRDGALRESDRKRIERELQKDLDAARYVQRSAALGSLIREAWSEGPTAPSADRLLAAIAPEMRKVDAERRPSSAAGRAVQALQRWLRDSLDGLGGKWIAAGGVVAAVCVVFLLAPRAMDPSEAAQVPEAVASFVVPSPSLTVQLASDSTASGGPQLGELSWPSAVYDLAQEDVPLMVSEKDGAIVILMGEPEPEPGEDISSSHGLEDLA